jgi:hypothetical protein
VVLQKYYLYVWADEFDLVVCGSDESGYVEWE